MGEVEKNIAWGGIQMAMNAHWVHLKHKPDVIYLSPQRYHLYLNTLYPEQIEGGIKYMGIPVESSMTEDFLHGRSRFTI